MFRRKAHPRVRPRGPVECRDEQATHRANVHKYSRGHASLTFVPEYLCTCYLAGAISGAFAANTADESTIGREIRGKSRGEPGAARLRSYLNRCAAHLTFVPLSLCVGFRSWSVLINTPRCPPTGVSFGDTHRARKIVLLTKGIDDERDKPSVTCEGHRNNVPFVSCEYLCRGQENTGENPGESKINSHFNRNEKSRRIIEGVERVCCRVWILTILERRGIPFRRFS